MAQGSCKSLHVNEPSVAPRLDDLDRRIVAALQADPRGSWSQLGGVVGVSETTVLRRVQRLRDSGLLVIIGAPDALRCGLGQPALLLFRALPGEGPRLAHLLAERPDVRYVALLTGRNDVICELVAPDRRYLSQVLTQELPRTGALINTTTAVLLKTFKTQDQWSRALLHPGASTQPGEDAAEEPTERRGKLDEMDMRLLSALVPDGRRSYADLSQDLGLSETAIARRTNALTAAQQLYFVAMVDPAALGFELEVWVYLRVELAALESVGQALANMTPVRYVSATAGHSDLACEAIFHDTAELYEFVTDQLSQLPGIREIEVDVVLESVKRAFRYPLFGASNVTVAAELAAGPSSQGQAPREDRRPTTTPPATNTF